MMDADREDTQAICRRKIATARRRFAPRAMASPAPPPTLEDILTDIKQGVSVAKLQYNIVFQYISKVQEEPMSLSDDGILPFVPSGKMLAEEGEVAKSLSKQVALLVAVATCKPLSFSPLPALKMYLKRHIKNLTSRDENDCLRSGLVLVVALYREARIRRVLLDCGIGKALLKLTLQARDGSLGLLTLLADKVYLDEKTVLFSQSSDQIRERFMMRVLTAEFLILLEKDSSAEKLKFMLDAIASMFQSPLAKLDDTNCTFFLRRLRSRSSFLKSEHAVHSSLVNLLVNLSSHSNVLIAREAALCLEHFEQSAGHETQTDDSDV